MILHANQKRDGYRLHWVRRREKPGYISIRYGERLPGLQSFGRFSRKSHKKQLQSSGIP
uniref:Uncharacterized protein n=1 Tax=Faecalibaculum rodentium TaxID=1702221 RepID=A0A140DTG1_9FIRM|nr:hypothetical protein AALO17_08040 [Faecalibaculum rodentium]